MVWDYTCRDSLCQSNIQTTSAEAGKAAQKAETTKLATYNNLIGDYQVIPVANETLGAWGPLGLKFLKDIGSRISESTGEKRSTQYLFQRLSMATQRGNVASILGTTPNMRNLDEIFYL